MLRDTFDVHYVLLSKTHMFPLYLVISNIGFSCFSYCGYRLFHYYLALGSKLYFRVVSVTFSYSLILRTHLFWNGFLPGSILELNRWRAMVPLSGLRYLEAKLTRLSVYCLFDCYSPSEGQITDV